MPATKPRASRREEPVAWVDVALPVPPDQAFSYSVPPALAAAAGVGRVVRVPFGRRKLQGVVVAVHDERPAVKGMRAVAELLDEPWCLDADALALARWLAAYYATSLGEALALALPPRPGTTARRRPWKDPGDAPAAEAVLHPLPEQHEALERIGGAMERGEGGSFLLHGVTGSGKTEVYLQLIARAVESGQQALVLLPEIALTPQTLRRIERRFPGRVAPYHSRLSHGERCAVWAAAASGELDVVVGARSAVFVPRPKLGLVVVDEEHEPSYKADTRPRYHGRDIALVRAAQRGVPCVLGSATPSAESWHNAREGKHVLLSLPARPGGGALPAVQLLDRRADPNPGDPLGPFLQRALAETLDRGEQAILFHNRRGYARFLQCRPCGEVVQCPNCDISLTYHLGDDRLHCHYCGRRELRPRECPGCGDGPMLERGSGTEKLEATLQNRLPDARLLRLDQDSTSRKGDLDRILSAFGRGEADVLVGTQMVAKGLHFPRVTLVGVVDADAGLHFPDFRAHERSFQLLTQVAGRSGRGAPGRVLVQSFDPGHRVLERVVGHDVPGFLDEELAQRHALGYPPARRLVAITVTAPDEALLDAALARLSTEVGRRLAGSGVQLLGPARAVLARINRRWRGQLLLKGGLSGEGKRELVELFARLAREIPRGSGLDWALDVDPQQLL